MPQQSKPQRETVGRVMHEFKEGELETSRGTPVRSRRQARCMRPATSALGRRS